MDFIQLLVDDRQKVIDKSIDNYALSLSHLPKEERDKLMYDYVSKWKIRLSNIADDKLADPIIRQVARINLTMVDSLLLTLTRVS